jgi:hypothetical protein
MQLSLPKIFLGLAVVGVAVLAGNNRANAQDPVHGVPSFSYDYPSLSLHQMILGSTCLSLPSAGLDLDCNPAFLANEEKHDLRLNLAFNDQVKKVNEYRLKLDQNDTSGIINSVLGSREPVVARATSAIWYQQDWWAIGYVPVRGGFATRSTNPAYPRLAAHVYHESDLFGKAGFIASEDKNLEVGVQLRYVEREFFRKEFDLFDALSDPTQLQIEKQKILYAEPGINYSFDSSWSSAISMALTQMPIIQSGYQSPFLPVLDMGFRTTPPFAGGKLTTTTHFNNRPDRADILSRFMWGAQYELTDLAAFSLSLGKSEMGIGIDGNLDSVVLGLGYKVEEVDPDSWQSSRISTVLFEAGLVF